MMSNKTYDILKQIAQAKHLRHAAMNDDGDAYIWADCGGSAEVTYIGKA